MCCCWKHIVVEDKELFAFRFFVRRFDFRVDDESVSTGAVMVGFGDINSL